MIKNYDRVCALINLDNLLYNLKSIKENIKEDTDIYAVVKADGYGHGAIPIVKELDQINYIRGFAVATPEEALQLKEKGIKKDILILGYCFPYSYKALIENEIRIALFREDTLEELAKAAKEVGKKARVHIKVDTGMGRIGISPYDYGFELVNKAINNEYIDVEGIFTHFAKADEKDKKSANEQFEMFTSFVDGLEEACDYKFKIKHCSNSAAIIDMGYANLDAVRAGIILYGLWPSDEVNKDIIDIKPVMKLISHITYIKEVPPGTSISYGGTYITKSGAKIATIPVGYADGYPRALSNKGSVIIKGQKVPIVGRVCMDQFMVDVTSIPNIEMGDEVILIGEDKNLKITIEELGILSDHLNYELACDFGKRVPRLFIKDDKYISAMDYFTDVPVVDLH